MAEGRCTTLTVMVDMLRWESHHDSRFLTSGLASMSASPTVILLKLTFSSCRSVPISKNSVLSSFSFNLSLINAVTQSIQCDVIVTWDTRAEGQIQLWGSGRVFSGSEIWPKYNVGIRKTINILTGSGIWLLPGKRDSPNFGHGMRDFFFLLPVWREFGKSSRLK